jgi:hypothetical protein
MGGSLFSLTIPVFLSALAKPFLLGLSGVSVVAGLLAISNPRWFVRVATFGNRWIDTAKLFRVPADSRLRAFDRWVDMDGYAVPFTRLIGVAACLGASYLVYVCLTSA